MKVTKEDRNALKQVNNRVLTGILENELEEAIGNLKLSSEATFRYHQGTISILEDIVKLIKV